MYKFTSEAFRPIWDEAVSNNRWNEVGCGASAALVVVDGLVAYTAPGSPLELKDHSFISKGAEVLRIFRERGLPIFHTSVAYTDSGHKGGAFRNKVPILEVFDIEHAEGLGVVIPTWEALRGEEQLVKHYASVFTGTDLAAALVQLRIDTVFFMGLSTSGCVRTSAIDACERGYRSVIIGDACGDRHPTIHEASLFDVGAKYGDVIATDDLTTYLA